MPVMRSTPLTLLVTATLAAASFTSTAQAGVSNCIGRYFGWGWSEGYHAYENCPRNGPCNSPLVAAPCRSRQPAPPPCFVPAAPMHGPHAGRWMHPVPYPPFNNKPTKFNVAGGSPATLVLSL